MSIIFFPQGPSAHLSLITTLHRLVSDAVSTLDEDRDVTRAMLRRAVELLDAGGASRTGNEQGGLATWQARLAAKHIEANLDANIQVGDLAKLVRLSRSGFSRAFKVTFRLSPQHFIVGRRVARAQEMMISGDESLCHIAMTCGFCDQSHFSRAFRQVIGQSPFAWRRMNYDRQGDVRSVC